MGGMRRSVQDHPSAVLLVSQLAAVLLYPFFADSPAGRAGLGVVSMLVVGLALWAVRRTPALNVVAFSLGLPALVLTVAEAFSGHNDTLILLSALFHAPFYLYVSFGMIRYLFHDEHVSSDEFFAIGAAFTVVAWGFAYVFMGVQVLWPGSFAGPGSPEDPRGWFDLLFLSFTTLTSTGLSDVVPAGGHGRSVVMLEQLAGVMYLALVVARLVGMTVRPRSGSRPQG